MGWKLAGLDSGRSADAHRVKVRCALILSVTASLASFSTVGSHVRSDYKIGAPCAHSVFSPFSHGVRECALSLYASDPTAIFVDFWFG